MTTTTGNQITPDQPSPTTERPRRRRQALRVAGGLAAAGAALFLGACSASGPSQAAKHIAPSSAQRTASFPGIPGVSPHTSTAPNVGSQPQGPVTFTEYNYGTPSTYQLTVEDLVRQGPFVRLDVGIGCRTVNGCSDSSDFNVGGADYNNDSNTLDAVNLVDPNGKTTYAPVADAQGHPLSSLLPDTIPAGTTQRAWVTFPAPPTSVRSVTIQFPEGRFELFDVPVPATSTNWYPQAKAAPFSQPATSTSTTNLRLPTYDLTSSSVPGLVGRSTTGDQTTVTLSTDVLFDFNSAQLSPAAGTAISQVASAIDQSGQGTVVVTGYTDNIGDPSYNQTLSQQRAQAVVEALQAKATGSSVNYQAVGMGDADPVAPNQNTDGSDNPAGRAQNRRVTISYMVSSSSQASPPATPPTPPAPSPSANGVTYSLTLPYQEGQETYQVTADGTRADGPFTVLHATVTCERSDYSSGCNTGQDFVNPNSSSSNDANTADGLQLIDQTKATTYETVEAGGVPVSSTLPSNLPVGASVPVWVWYTPPAGDHLAVQLPGGGPVIQT